MHGLKSAVLASFLTVSVAVSATPVTVDLDYTGFTQGSQNGTITNSSTPQQTAAGQLGFNVSNIQGVSPFDLGSSISTFCVQIDQLLDQNSTQTYELVDAASYFGNTNIVNSIGALYTSYFGNINNATSSAAFQLALWELTNETSGSDDLSSGSFSASNFGGARAQANSWVSGLNSNDASDFDLYVLKSDNAQDQLVVTASSVPEPGTLALFGLVLGALGVKRVRNAREAKQA